MWWFENRMAELHHFLSTLRMPMIPRVSLDKPDTHPKKSVMSRPPTPNVRHIILFGPSAFVPALVARMGLDEEDLLPPDLRAGRV